jgi:hypothetical protein
VTCAAHAFNYFCEFWTKQEVPILFMRYEDLMNEPVDFCKKFFNFYNEEIVEVGSKLESDIIDYFEKNGLTSTFMEKQKSKNDQYSYYSDEQKLLIWKNNKKWFKFFGHLDEIKENIGDLVDDYDDIEDEGGFEQWNEKAFKDLKNIDIDKKVTMSNSDDEFHKQYLDPVTPFYHYYI